MPSLDIKAILINCCQPEVIGDAIQVTRDKLASLSSLEIETGVYANAFSTQAKNALAKIEHKADEIPGSQGFRETI